jgi:hypothetical protein
MMKPTFMSEHPRICVALHWQAPNIEICMADTSSHHTDQELVITKGRK